MDDQDNTNEPPEAQLTDVLERKDDKTADSSPAGDTSTSAGDEKSNASVAAIVNKSESDKDKETLNENIKPSANDDRTDTKQSESEDVTRISANGKESSSTNSNDSNAEQSTISSIVSGSPSAANAATAIPLLTPTPISALTSPAQNVATNIASGDDIKPVEKMETNAVADNLSVTKHEQEMISTIANIKKESTSESSTANEYPGKKLSLFIKKEPVDESADNNVGNTNIISGACNKNADATNDIKLSNDIKTEGKCGLDLTNVEPKQEDRESVRSAFEPHIKFSSMTKGSIESHMKFGTEIGKQNEPKFNLEHSGKYSMMAADLSQKYDMKSFVDQSNKFNNDGPNKHHMDGPHNDSGQPPNKIFSMEPSDVKYPLSDNQMKYPHPSEHIKFESAENMAIKRPPYSEPHSNMRSPYELSPMLKFPPGKILAIYYIHLYSLLSI